MPGVHCYLIYQQNVILHSMTPLARSDRNYCIGKELMTSPMKWGSERFPNSCGGLTAAQQILDHMTRPLSRGLDQSVLYSVPTTPYVDACWCPSRRNALSPQWWLAALLLFEQILYKATRWICLSLVVAYRNIKKLQRAPRLLMTYVCTRIDRKARSHLPYIAPIPKKDRIGNMNYGRVD